MGVAAQKNIDRFVTPPREFVLHNATDEVIETSWDGETRYLPPHDVVAGDYLERGGPAKDSEGNFIPGTLLVRDIVEKNELGGETLVWSSLNYVRHILGVDPKTGAANGPYAMRGVSLMPMDATPEEVSKVVREGRLRYETWYLEEAMRVVEECDARNDARKRAGMPTLSGDQRYDRAISILNANKIKVQEIERAKMDVDTTYENTPELEALAERLAKQAVEKVETQGDKADLVRKMLEDPEFKSELKKIYKMKKIPNLGNTKRAVI